jgi:hypothetical protein
VCFPLSLGGPYCLEGTALAITLDAIYNYKHSCPEARILSRECRLDTPRLKELRDGLKIKAMRTARTGGSDSENRMNHALWRRAAQLSGSRFFRRPLEQGRNDQHASRVLWRIGDWKHTTKGPYECIMGFPERGVPETLPAAGSTSDSGSRCSC